MDFEKIFIAARVAARAAVADEVAARPEDPNALDCGFAWVIVDGKSPFAAWCREQAKRWKDTPVEAAKFGSKGYPKGWQFWKPGGFGGQSIRIHRKGAEAFAEVLVAHGIKAEVGSRYD